MLYAVIDTNVLVSALLSSHDDSSTVVVRNHILEGTIVPLYNEGYTRNTWTSCTVLNSNSPQARLMTFLMPLPGMD